MKQNSAYLLLYERKEPLDAEDLELRESRAMKMTGSGVRPGSEKVGKIAVCVAPELLLSSEKLQAQIEVEGEKGSANQGLSLFEDEETIEERKRSTYADISLYRYPSEMKGEKGDREGEDEGKREEEEGEGGEGYIGREKDRERRVNFSADSWDEFEIKKEESVALENAQLYNILTPQKEDRSFLKPETGNGSNVRTRITHFPPIAKKVLQAVWTENLEFQTDRSLFNR